MSCEHFFHGYKEMILATHRHAQSPKSRVPTDALVWRSHVWCRLEFSPLVPASGTTNHAARSGSKTRGYRPAGARKVFALHHDRLCGAK